MMNFGLLRRQAMVQPITNQPELTIVGEPAAILPWPANVPASEPAPPVTAELRTKRFSDNTVERNQYTATISASNRSLSAVLQALAETCSSVEEFGRALGTDDQLILNIQIRV
ncbi:MAG TPA: hypothetical protein VFL82_15565 [Thermomicrobiales bacterium]|nr:hypothetical protein [Thermomicrobiales bacterium]